MFVGTQVNRRGKLVFSLEANSSYIGWMLRRLSTELKCSLP